MAKKPAIDGLARPKGFWDDAGKAAEKVLKQYGATASRKLNTQFARTATKKRAMAKTTKLAKQHMKVMKESGKNWSGGR